LAYNVSTWTISYGSTVLPRGRKNRKRKSERGKRALVYDPSSLPLLLSLSLSLSF
jgi:hypothetical protein